MQFHTAKRIAIANKESIICAWNLIEKKLMKIHKTEFIPVDSEHFSIMVINQKNTNVAQIQKIYITASGGPFLKWSKFLLLKR